MKTGCICGWVSENGTDERGECVDLLEKLRSRQARITVIGLGYVGLPLAVEKARAGFHVVGIDSNPDRVKMVNQGRNYIGDVVPEDLAAVVAEGHLRATATFEPVADADVVTICVPTPLDRHKQPDTSYIEHVVEASLPYLHAGQLVVLESTTYPGTTEEIIRPRVESLGLKVGEDVFLAFSPERVDPGNARYKTRNTPKVVGGITPRCTEMAKVLYENTLSAGVHTVSSTKAAEMTKLLENVFRAVNISLVNELAMLCERMGVDIWEVIEAASTKPFGYMPFYPGPGLGGHCIPLDPFYLSWKAKEYGFTTRFIELAGQINDGMPRHVVDLATCLLNKHGIAMHGARVMLVGVSYKRNVGDLRESPALELAALLGSRGAELCYHDPLVPSAELAGRSMRSVELDPESLDRIHLAIVVSNHDCIDFSQLMEHAPLVLDTRNASAGTCSDHVARLGTGSFASSEEGTGG